jgi:hypothetical protein
VKKSKAITLVLVTSALFLGCERDVRNEYGSLEDCVKDYKDPSKCQPDSRTSIGYGRYFGPWYRSSRSTDAAHNPSVVTRRASGVMRGGFGFTASRGGS